MDSVDAQLIAYLWICSGVGALFGASGSVFMGAPMFRGFFIPEMYLLGLVMFLWGTLTFIRAART